VAYGRFDSKIRFKNESDGQFDSRFERKKNDSQQSQVPIVNIQVRSAPDKGLQLSIHGSNRLDKWRFMGAILCVIILIYFYY